MVPSSWPRSCTGAVSPAPATTESLLSADLRVSGQLHPVYGAAPWTHQSGLCGRPGHFIQLAADYITSGQTHRFGDQGESPCPADLWSTGEGEGGPLEHGGLGKHSPSFWSTGG